MKIACLISSLRLGGAEKQLVGLACMLKDAGYDVEVITYRAGDFYSGRLAAASVPQYRIDTSADLDIIRNIAAHLNESACDVLISFRAGTNVKACLVKRLCPSLKLVVSERNFNISYHFYDALRFAFYRRYADRVVCNSFAQSEFIKEHFPSLSGRLSTIPNFVELEKFVPISDSPSSGRIVTTARVCRRKNVLGLISAARILKETGVHFNVIWYGKSRNSKYFLLCMRAIRKYGLEGVFRIEDASRCTESIYRDASVFCLPSFYEGTSNAVCEALASGLPVACSSVSDNALYVVPGRNGALFNPRDSAAIAEALRGLLHLSSECRDEMSSASRKTAEENFSLPAFRAAYLSLLSGLKK